MLFRNQRGALVDGFAHAVEDASQHVRSDVELDGFAQKTRLRGADLQALRTFEKLQQRLVLIDFQHAASADASVGLLNFYQFVVFNARNLLNQHQRAYDFLNGAIFFTHAARLLPSERESARWSP
ncbi:hypothetical protein SDC9_184618 [bioreactor metagenome]|uniref:Uncharacterized protein n=1 Tax=bioreactor metagenome TaxID=1076179 RepID=A0A645HFE1_9ZZZZ